MLGPHAYSLINALDGLAASAFTWSAGGTTNKAFLNDGYLDRRQVIGAAAASGISLVIDLGSAQELTAFAVLNSNAAVQKTDATLRVRGADDAGISVNVVVAKAASTLYSATTPRNKDHFVAFDGEQRRYWQLTWTWTGTVTNFAIGELWACRTGELLQLGRRGGWGSSAGKRMYTAKEQFQTGDTRGLKLGGPQRYESLLFTDLNPTERDELDDMWSGAQADVGRMLWVDSLEVGPDAAPADFQNCMFGSLDSNELAFDNHDFDLFNTRAFVMRSAGREAGA